MLWMLNCAGHLSLSTVDKMDRARMIISFVLYFTVLYAIYLVFGNSLNRVIKSIKRLFYKKKTETAVQKYLKNVFLSISDYNSDYEIQVKISNLYWKTTLIFISFFLVVFVFNYNGKNILKAMWDGVVPGTIVASIPFVKLIIQLYDTRRKSSYEATILVNEIFNQYRVKN